MCWMSRLVAIPRLVVTTADAAAVVTAWRVWNAQSVRIRRAVLPVVIAVVGSSLVDLHPLAAQSCFSAHPLPRCRSYWITEAGLSTRLNPKPERSSGFLTLDVGYMVNSSPRSAVGATAFLQSTGMGFRARYRRWLNSSMSLDVAPGLVLQTTSGQFVRKAPTFSGQVGLNLGPALAVTGQMDVTRSADRSTSDGRSTDVGWYAGGRLGSGPGLAGILGCVALGVLLAATWTWD